MAPRSPARRAAPAADDSDDELGGNDAPWEWIYDGEQRAAPDDAPDAPDVHGDRKRRKLSGGRIVGARMGSFQCRVGDCVLLKADGSSGDAWVAIICEFIDGDADGDMAANFMWFSTEKEIRNSNRKRHDYYWVRPWPAAASPRRRPSLTTRLQNELYISPSWDVNPLASIDGKATVTSLEAFLRKFPSGKVVRSLPDFGRIFVCRRGCNTRTATYTDEFVWEDVYRGGDDIFDLIERVEQGIKPLRARRKPRSQSPHEAAYVPPPRRRPSQRHGQPRRRALGPRRGTRPFLADPVALMVGSRATAKRLEFTPLATRKLSPSSVQSSPFQIARSRLHVSSVPDSLPCREGEFSLVYSHLEAAIGEGTGNCIYISGTPGTGKTATVREVIARLEKAVGSDELDDFIFVEINGMKITDPHQSYTLLWEALKGQRASPLQALDLLEREFSNPSPRRIPCVVLMDELDQLVTKNQAVMYNFFKWPTLRHSRLIVLAVANTMDLPERTLSNKISSRLGTSVSSPRTRWGIG